MHGIKTPDRAQRSTSTRRKAPIAITRAIDTHARDEQANWRLPLLHVPRPPSRSRSPATGEFRSGRYMRSDESDSSRRKRGET
jgi:hypothetical protein